MFAPLTTALILLVGITLYAVIHSLFTAYYRHQRRMYIYFVLMSIFICGYIFSRLFALHDSNPMEFVASQRWGFSAAILFFLSLLFFTGEYANWRPRRILIPLASATLALLILNLSLPYGLGYSSFPKLQQTSLPWGELVNDTSIHDGTSWLPLVWLTFFGVIAFQLTAAMRLRNAGDKQRGNVLLWSSGVILAATIWNLLVNFKVIHNTQLAEFSFIAIIIMTSLNLTREARATYLRAEAAEDMWSSMVMSAPSFILILDLDGMILFMNRVLPDDNIKDIIGTHVENYLDADSRIAIRESLENVLSTNKPLKVQLRLDEPRNLWFDAQLAPLIVSGKPKQIILTATDISEHIATKHKLEISEARHRQLLHTIPYGVQEIDKQGTITYSNPAHDRLFGYEPGQMQGMSIFDLPAHTDEVDKLREYIQFVYEHQPVPITYIKQDRRKNGEVFEINIDWNYLRDEKNNVTGLISVLTDITEQVKANKALSESEEKFRQLAENISKVFFIRDLASNRMLYVSPAYTNIWGRDVQEIYDDPADFINSIHPDDKDRVVHLLTEQNQTGNLFDAQYRIIDSQGEMHWIHARSYPIDNGTGNITRIAGIVEDITQRKYDELALYESNSRLRQVVESSDDMFWISELSPIKLVFVSPVCEKIFGITADQLYRNPELWLEYIHEDDKAIQRARFEQFASGKNYNFQTEYRIINARGELRYIASRSNPIYDSSGNITRIGGVAKDVTAFKMAENNLQARTLDLEQAHEFTSAIVDTVGSLIIVLDRHGRIVRFNNACEYISGYSAEEVFGRVFWEFLLLPEERDGVKDVFRRLAAGDFPSHYDNYWLHKNGQKRFLSWSNTCLTDADGNVEYVIGTAVDITEQRHAEAALRESSEKYRTLMEYASDIILIGDLNGNLIEGNSSALAVLGYSHEELNGLNFQNIHPPGQLSRVLSDFQKLVLTGSTVMLDTELVSKTGELIPVDITANLIEYQGRKVAVAFMRDIRARKKAEEEHRHIEQRHREMLVREVHHRIKNNLQGVIGLLRNSLLEKEVINSVTEQLVTRAINQIATIAMVHGLQAHFKSGRVLICEITSAIVLQARNVAPDDLHIEFHNNITQPAILQEGEAIPLALIINEIITNAIKHIPASANNKQVIVDIKGSPAQNIELLVFNTGARSSKGQKTDATKLSGVGLDLIHALLPKNHAQFSLYDDPQGNGVYAKLHIDSSILSPESELEATQIDHSLN